ncbi:haloacid dehalogenase type II [Halobacillus litoralis]|uniref:haloacid dehalogenase type II n=1 Tax=Halobacillus litoralis TaxID=45668 RepID=UPI001CD4318E|nr:haloacid dehalogenase type II [Halobacillus litoralis]MCA0971615.1 haloacid dehalogenase type II [Halobacillus litoralis]
MAYHAYVFDAYGTLFDVHSVMEKIHEHYPDKGSRISQEWRQRQIHYFLVRQLANGYRPFSEITEWALRDALHFSGADIHENTVKDLMKQYEKLSPYEEVNSLHERYPNHTFTIFSNGTKSMLEPLLQHNGLTDQFGLLSADEPKVYKPHPDAYQFAQDNLGFEKEEILFFSSNPWDITGAASYGFHTAWVNRNDQKWPELGIEPTYIIQDLNEIPE